MVTRFGVGYRKAPDGLTAATDFTGLLGGFGVEDDEGESSALRISEGGGGGHAELDIPVDLALNWCARGCSNRSARRDRNRRSPALRGSLNLAMLRISG